MEVNRHRHIFGSQHSFELNRKKVTGLCELRIENNESLISNYLKKNIIEDSSQRMLEMHLFFRHFMHLLRQTKVMPFTQEPQNVVQHDLTKGKRETHDNISLPIIIIIKRYFPRIKLAK